MLGEKWETMIIIYSILALKENATRTIYTVSTVCTSLAWKQYSELNSEEQESVAVVVVVFLKFLYGL